MSSAQLIRLSLLIGPMGWPLPLLSGRNVRCCPCPEVSARAAACCRRLVASARVLTAAAALVAVDLVAPEPVVQLPYRARDHGLPPGGGRPALYGSMSPVTQPLFVVVSGPPASGKSTL